MVKQLEPLFNVLPDEWRLYKLEKKLSTVLARRPANLTGRQLYVKELNAQARKLRSEGRDVAPRIHVDIMNKHGATWRSMSLPARADYERRAKASQAELTITNDNDAANLRSDIAASQQKVAELHSSSVAMSVLGCRFTSAGIVLFQEALESTDYAVHRSKDLLAQKLATKVGQPPEHIRDLLASVVLPPPAKVRQIRPNWVRLLATHRSFFQNSIFRFDRLDGPRFAKFTLAKQCPLLVGMCEVTPLPQDVVMPDHLGWTFDHMHT